MDYSKLTEVVQEALKQDKLIMFLTGAGVSKSSGIPTFRDSNDGVWVIGTDNYRPEETGTLAYFKQNPLKVWDFTLRLKHLCESVNPNVSHYSLTKIESLLGNQFLLVTQNVDGLDKRAGTVNVYEAHGNLIDCRCLNDCSRVRYPYPPPAEKGSYQLEDLLCPNCKSTILRPHTMWFDEKYDERNYHKDTLMKLAKKTGVVITLGTTGLTNLPLWLVENSSQRGGWLINVDPKENEFSKLVENRNKGMFFKTSSEVFLPELFSFLRSKMI